jgi:predicted dehydrogenase
MKKVRWGIVGPGKIAEKFARDIEWARHAELIAVASRSEHNAIHFAKKYKLKKAYGSYEDLYADKEIDAIYVATPHPFHFKNASDASAAGKAVLCEKPLTMNLKECEDLIKISHKNNTYLMEGMWTYFLPAINKTLDWISDNKIGKIKHIRSEFGFTLPYDPLHRGYNPELGGGALLDIGIYCLALNRLIFEEAPQKILVSARFSPEKIDTELAGILEYPDYSASFHCSFLLKLPNVAYITGEKGYIKIPDFWRASECFLFQDNKLVEHYNDKRTTNGFDFEIEAACLDILNGKKESEIMPHRISLFIQDQMEKILRQLNQA